MATRVGDEALDDARDEFRRAGVAHRAAYLAEFGVEPELFEVGDWDAAGFLAAQGRYRGGVDLSDQACYDAVRASYEDGLFGTTINRQGDD